MRQCSVDRSFSARRSWGRQCRAAYCGLVHGSDPTGALGQKIAGQIGTAIAQLHSIATGGDSLGVSKPLQRRCRPDQRRSHRPLWMPNWA
jgi:hypothetical protein